MVVHRRHVLRDLGLLRLKDTGVDSAKPTIDERMKATAWTI
jgi:hypothetical protein